MKEKKIQQQLNAWIDGELDSQQAEQIEYSIHNNAAVQAEYDKLVRLNELLQTQNVPVANPGFLFQLKIRLQQNQAKSIRRTISFNWWPKFAMPVAVFAGLLAGILLGIEIHQVLYTESAQQGEIARQYFGNDALPVIPDDSITAGYIQLSNQVNR